MSESTLQDHLSTGLTHICQCWAVTRNDGVMLGFTDHDQELSFEGVTFQANSGLSAKSLSTSTGLSVNNTEAVGALTSSVMTASDIAAGLYDHAAIQIWRVNWSNVTERVMMFRGHLGEITRNGTAFQVDLRGLTEALNRVQGRSYLKGCSARLGDRACRIDLSDARYSVDAELDQDQTGLVLNLPQVQFDSGWFDFGVLQVLDGALKGASLGIKSDEVKEGRRRITLHTPLSWSLKKGQRVRLTAGCDKRFATCREKFKNGLNYQGFPHLPGDDWLMAVPRSNDDNNGESLQS